LNGSVTPVVPKLFRAFSQIEVTIRCYYPQYFAVIAHNVEQNCDFGSALPPKNNILLLGGNLPQFGNHCVTSRFIPNCSLESLAVPRVGADKMVLVKPFQPVYFCKHNPVSYRMSLSVTSYIGDGEPIHWTITGCMNVECCWREAKLLIFILKFYFHLSSENRRESYPKM